MSVPNPVDLVANVASGGLYGAGKGIANAADTGKVSDVVGGLNNLGPFGSVVAPVSPQLAQAGNLAGAGAGIGGALAGGTSAAAAPTSTASINPAYFGFDADTLASLGTGEYGQFAGGIPQAAFGSGAGAGAAAGAGAGNTGALVGASAGQQLASLLGGASPFLAVPQGGATPIGTTAPGGLTKQQLAALTAQQDEAHKGLAPRFEQRQAGTKESPGIASFGQYFGGGQ